MKGNRDTSMKKMRRIDRTLQAIVETEILPLYEGFDRAHGVDHA
jgi:hypothetical protein